jgi:hypothetical protein
MAKQGDIRWSYRRDWSQRGLRKWEALCEQWGEDEYGDKGWQCIYSWRYLTSFRPEAKRRAAERRLARAWRFYS